MLSQVKASNVYHIKSALNPTKKQQLDNKHSTDIRQEQLPKTAVTDNWARLRRVFNNLVLLWKQQECHML